MFNPLSKKLSQARKASTFIFNPTKRIDKIKDMLGDNQSAKLQIGKNLISIRRDSSANYHVEIVKLKENGTKGKNLIFNLDNQGKVVSKYLDNSKGKIDGLLLTNIALGILAFLNTNQHS